MDQALLAALVSLLTALAAYVRGSVERQKENKADLDAAFRKIRDLEDRVADLEDGESGNDSPTCFTDCPRKEA